MKKVIVMQGIAGSGKSTVIDTIKIGCNGNCRVINYDEIRYNLNIAHNGNGWDEKKHAIVEATWERAINVACLKADTLIVDDTHTSKHRLDQTLVNIAAGMKSCRVLNYEVVIAKVDTLARVCKERREECNFPMKIIDRHEAQMAQWKRAADYPTLVKEVWVFEDRMVKKLC